jgi:hypothetical protein
LVFHDAIALRRFRRIFSSNTFVESTFLVVIWDWEPLCDECCFTGVQEVSEYRRYGEASCDGMFVTVLLGAGFLLSLDIPSIAWIRL